MHTELINIGTELLRGHLNTNSAYISRELTNIGIEVNLISTVEDKEKLLEDFFKKAIERSQVIITTGGLGPTFDDLTRDIMAKVINLKLVFDREVMHNIAAHFAKRNLEMPQENEKQAYIIEGAKVIPNLTGTAPGMIIQLKKMTVGPIIIMLPGPPSEMQPMMKKKVLPFLKIRYEHKIRKSIMLHACGLPESAVEEKIRDLILIEKKIGGLNFSLRAHGAIVDLEISAQGEDEILIDEVLFKIKSEIYQRLGDSIYGENRETLEAVVGKLLNRRKLTLAIAESCSGGLIAHRMTNIAGSSVYFKQGIIAYSNEVKINMLKVKKRDLDLFGAVSKEVALSMAEGIRQSAQVDIGLATTGIAGPTGGSLSKPVGLVYLAFVSAKKRECKECRFVGKREKIKEEVADAVFDLLRKQLITDKN